MRLIVCHPVALADVKNFKGAWAYAGGGLDDFEQIRVQLGDQVTPLCSPQEFQHYVSRSRDGISAWVDANLTGLRAEDVLSTPLSRNPFLPLFANLVWARVIADALAEQVADVLVVTRSRGLARTLENHAISLGIASLKFGTFHFMLTTARQRIRSLAKWGRDLVHATCRAILARAMLGETQVDKVRKADIFVDTYLYPNDVMPDGSVTHRYFPGLVDWYLLRGYSPAYYPFLFRIPLLRLGALYRGYRRSRYLFAPPELFYRFSDILGSAVRILVRGLGHRRLRHPSVFNVDVSALVATEVFGSAVESLPQVLLSLTPMRMAESGVRPRWLLDWFENQSIDQATTIGFRAAFPDCRLIALRLYAQYSSNLLSFQVTSRERREGLVPAEHWLGGAAWLPIATKYDSDGGYKIVPSLRSSYLHQQQPPAHDGTDLVVLLTHSLQESIQVLAYLERALPTLVRLFPVLRIKTHPSLSAERLRRATQSRYPRLWAAEQIRWDNPALSSLLASARLVVSAGTSSAIEAVTMGVPVILIGAEVGIDMCPLEFVDKRMWRIVFCADQFDLAVRDWTPSHPIPREDRLAIGRLVMKDCFEPVTPESMERFHLE